MCVCGGQGVYFEKVLKSSNTSLWVRNIQMYISGIAVTLLGVYVTDGAKVVEKGFFFGYTPWVCFVVCKWPVAPAGMCSKTGHLLFLAVVIDPLCFCLNGPPPPLVLASVGGLYTSIVVKYTDNIMKGFSAASAIVISTVASVTLFGLQISKL